MAGHTGTEAYPQFDWVKRRARHGGTPADGRTRVGAAVSGLVGTPRLHPTHLRATGVLTDKGSHPEVAGVVTGDEVMRRRHTAVTAPALHGERGSTGMSGRWRALPLTRANERRGRRRPEAAEIAR